MLVCESGHESPEGLFVALIGHTGIGACYATFMWRTRVALNNRDANRTKEIGVRMWRMAYPNSTGAHRLEDLKSCGVAIVHLFPFTTLVN